jgi:hypothetical protein
MASFVKFRDGSVGDVDQSRLVPVNGGIQIIRGSEVDMVPYSNNTLAQSDLAYLITQLTVIDISGGGGALAFTSINGGSSVVIGEAPPVSPQYLPVVGTGFLAWSANPTLATYFKFVLDPSNTSTLAYVVNSDTSITVQGGFDSWFGLAGNWEMFYSPDNGATWVDTGIFITAA